MLLNEIFRNIPHATATGNTAGQLLPHGLKEIEDGLVTVGSDAHFLPASEQFGNNLRASFGLACSRRTLDTEGGFTHRECNAEGGLGRRLTTLEQRCALYPARNLGWLPQQQAPQGGGDKLFVFPLGCNRKQSIRNWARVDPFIRY